ncbi:hypothetical protein [Pseudomonas oryzihabitans]|uniref:Uncharacterized protein n=1 Tax=Pseudomonas oryzihabitans TaxID=47885 RepID=A0AAJ2BJM9_9PSED|nr:hypothetical protein [Pseudomonas psychrotolerans]MDR6235488.1 hypothetical protein [Pseudomonas psychrotolerans]MDR6355259.1 hypothetical protein [Pseudomonas psychrotolerans]
MPYRSPDLEMMEQKPLLELEREVERRRRNVESNRRWVKHQLYRLAKQQEDLETLEALLERKRTLGR